MSPAFTAKKFSNSLMAHAIFTSDRALSVISMATAVPRTNSEHIGCSQLCRIMGLTHSKPVALNGIPCVVRVCTDGKVGRIDARTIVARVPDQQPTRDLPVGEFVANTVGADVLSINPKLPIALNVASQPKPATSRIIDFLPEPLGGRKVGLHGTNLLCRAATVTSGAPHLSYHTVWQLIRVSGG